MSGEITERILLYLAHTESVHSLQLAKEFEVDHQKIVGGIKSLQSHADLIEAEQKSEVKAELTEEGLEILKNGSHEACVFNATPAGPQGISQTELMKILGANGKIGLNKALQCGWVKIVKDGGAPNITRIVDKIEDNTKKLLDSIHSGSNVDKTTSNELKKRKLMSMTTVNYYTIRRGSAFKTTVDKQETDLTPELMINREYEKKSFKVYNFNALGAPLSAGHLHPLLKVRTEFRTILSEMGFSEMETNRFIESSFWNFDALFVPQKHPARDAQDTFFLSRPSTCNNLPKDYMERVQKVHSVGDYGSQGYGSDWKIEEARKNVLRTHTTAISARLLYAIGQNKPFIPTKMFSIDRVFRNETLDATHLAEFHQVEGVVADRNLNLGHLTGIMTEFFRRLGIDKLRFKPAYNPYTEPSMEVFAFHEGLKKWVEVGNSGMFRPEMLLPMGLPDDVRVIAWGLSLERPTMIRYGIDNIRDLVGPRVDLQMVYNNPLCRLDKK